MARQRVGRRPWLFDRVKDDRGRTVGLYRANDRVDNAEARKELTQAELRSILKLVGKRSDLVAARSVIIGFYCLFTVLAIVAVVLSIVERNWEAGVRNLAYLAIYIILLVVLQRTIIGWVRRPIRDALLKHARCASCGYRIDGLEQESDGCTVCPECGAAWRLLASELITRVEAGRRSWNDQWPSPD
jgi:predicted RNA-binding Zn-ribbon protein involved in translation (DUF1610 family)